MYRIFLLIFCTISVQNIFSQVGINTNNPKAVLQINASDTSNPTNKDGILLPRVNSFHPINTVPDLLTVFYNNTDSYERGVYYSAYLSWIKLLCLDRIKINDLLDALSDKGANEGSSVYLGKDSGTGFTQNNYQNTAIGKRAITELSSYQTTIGNIGYGNTRAPSNNGVSIGNISALQNNNVGIAANLSIAIGSYSGAEAVNNTIGIGFQALQYNKVSGNIGLGTYTIRNNLTAIDNIAINESALGYLKNGANNIAIGKNSLLYLNGANNNIAIGNGANDSNNNGNNNISLGLSALQFSKGNNNTAIGFENLFSFEGNNTIGIGSLTERINYNTSDNGLIIGSNIKFAHSNTDNQINIANTIFGTDINGINNTISTGNVGIAVTSPFEKLEISNAVKIANTNNTNTGTIRWNGNDFEGYNGINWLSLTSGEYWSFTGNNFTDANINFLGTNDNTDIVFKTNNTERMRLTVSGKLKLINNVDDNIFVKNSSYYSHGVDANLVFHQNAASDSWLLASQENVDDTSGIFGNSEFITLWGTGNYNNYLIRFINENQWSDNNGNPYDNSSVVAYIDKNGQFFQASDINRKQNIEKIKNPVETLNKINGYTYQFKDNNTITSGVIAQEIHNNFNEAVYKNSNQESFVHYNGLIPLLIENIKDNQNKIENLKNKLEKLKKLKKQVEKLQKIK